MYCSLPWLACWARRLVVLHACSQSSLVQAGCAYPTLAPVLQCWRLRPQKRLSTPRLMVCHGFTRVAMPCVCECALRRQASGSAGDNARKQRAAPASPAPQCLSLDVACGRALRASGGLLQRGRAPLPGRCDSRGRQQPGAQPALLVWQRPWAIFTKALFIKVVLCCRSGWKQLQVRLPVTQQLSSSFAPAHGHGLGMRKPVDERLCL